jgi:Zn-dependent protease with chaperone function/competence protein ComGC
MNLVYKNEKNLFPIALIISGIFWLLIVVGTLGIALVYVLLFYLFFLFAHSGFISYLKGNGVKITEEQYPDLYRRIIYCCDKVGLKEIPDAYLLRTDFFNALATRFLGRNFIVLFTDVLDALEDQPGAINFYIGHEAGHIHRGHLLWNAFIFPALLLPILGAAYRRAEEYTCDRYGTVCCESDEDVKVALATIAAGDTRWKSFSLNPYLEQIQTTSGFWMSFNEITGDYPWLTKRMATALAFRRGDELKHPRRHWFAWFLSIFIPRLGSGGVVSLMITVMIIGILAAIAIPSYQDYTMRVKTSSGYTAAGEVRDLVTNYVVEQGEWPQSLVDLGYQTEAIDDPGGNYSISIYENGLIGISVGTDASGDTRYVVLEPVVEDEQLNWICYGENIPNQVLPPDCRE